MKKKEKIEEGAERGSSSSFSGCRALVQLVHLSINILFQCRITLPECLVFLYVQLFSLIFIPEPHTLYNRLIYYLGSRICLLSLVDTTKICFAQRYTLSFPHFVGRYLISCTLWESKILPACKVWESQSIPPMQSKYLLYLPGIVDRYLY